jgi:16S rRNA (uracil1498-N3)-methyltransferase
MVEPLFHNDNLKDALKGSVVELTGPEAKHAITVRRMRVSEAIQLSNGEGLRVKGNIEEIAGNSLSVLVSEVIQEPLPDRQLVLVQALAKGDRDELAIQAATELGITEVIPWQAARSISRWDGAKQLKGQERWQLIVNEASKQSLRAYNPKVHGILESKALAKAFAEFDLVLVLDTTATSLLSSVKLPEQAKIALVVGPEGGIEQSELDLFVSSGAKLISLGASVLRTSTAGMAAVAAITLGNL